MKRLILAVLVPLFFLTGCFDDPALERLRQIAQSLTDAEVDALKKALDDLTKKKKSEDRMSFPLKGYSPGRAYMQQHYGRDSLDVDNLPTYDIRELPKLTSSDGAEHQAVYHDHEWNLYGIGIPIPRERMRLFVGVDQGTKHIAGLGVVGKREGFDVRHGTLNDGTGRETVEAFLATAPRRYASAPTVKLIGSANADEINRFVAAVRLVNAALPLDMRMAMGDPRPTHSRRADHRGPGSEVSTIHVEFAPHTDFRSGTGGTTWNLPSGDAGIKSSYVKINRSAFGSGSNRHFVTLLAHELLHAMGLGHVAVEYDTIMENTRDIYTKVQGARSDSPVSVTPGSVPQPMSLLFPADREALRALYGEFGPWASTSTHLHGNGPHVAFGVAWRNGYAEPWAHGYMPSQDLADNRQLGGGATWEGALLGFTPDAEPVAGDAQIAVDLSALEGRADFTVLEKWATGAAPGYRGTGARWGDGDLGYSIAVRGNTFKQTGGDEGFLTGIFTGTNHEGAAGTLERSDLTAAFGASR